MALLISVSQHSDIQESNSHWNTYLIFLLSLSDRSLAVLDQYIYFCISWAWTWCQNYFWEATMRSHSPTRSAKWVLHPESQVRKIYIPSLNCTKSFSLSSRVRKSAGTCKEMPRSDPRAVDVSQPHRPAAGTQEESSSGRCAHENGFLGAAFLTLFPYGRVGSLKMSCVAAWRAFSSWDATSAHTCLRVLRCVSTWWLEHLRLPSRQYCT